MLRNKIIYSITLIFLLTSCGGGWDSVKRGLTGGKKLSTDEFMVKKKDPLILPPQYDKLPLPKSSDLQEKEDNTIESILKTGKNSEIKKKEIFFNIIFFNFFFKFIFC